MQSLRRPGTISSRHQQQVLLQQPRRPLCLRKMTPSFDHRLMMKQTQMSMQATTPLQQ